MKISQQETPKPGHSINNIKKFGVLKSGPHLPKKFKAF